MSRDRQTDAAKDAAMRARVAGKQETERRSGSFETHISSETVSDLDAEHPVGAPRDEAFASAGKLLAEAALILEQEGWMLARLAREFNSGRLRAFAERYEPWKKRVQEARKLDPDMWPEPEDNS